MGDGGRSASTTASHGKAIQSATGIGEKSLIGIKRSVSKKGQVQVRLDVKSNTKKGYKRYYLSENEARLAVAAAKKNRGRATVVLAGRKSTKAHGLLNLKSKDVVGLDSALGGSSKNAKQLFKRTKQSSPQRQALTSIKQDTTRLRNAIARQAKTTRRRRKK